MKKLSASQKRYLLEAAKRYHEALNGSPAEEYLRARGLAGAADKFALGWVDDPAPGHEAFRGWLAIPYLRWSPTEGSSVVSIRFRCIRDHEHEGHGKYMTVAGDSPWLFNTIAVHETNDRIGIAEGEFDAMTATAAGIPTVGVPGVESWEDYHARLFDGYREVFVFADADDAGRKFARKVATQVQNTRVITFDEGHDTNSFVLQHGPSALIERITN